MMRKILEAVIRDEIQTSNYVHDRRIFITIQ